MYQVQIRNEAGEWEPHGSPTVSYMSARALAAALREERLIDTDVRVACVDSAAQS